MQFTTKLKPAIIASFFLGPVLLLLSALYAGLIQDSMFKQGVLGQYGAIFLIGINLSIAYLIGKSKPKLGVVVMITGIIGGSAAVGGFMANYSIDFISSIAGFDARALLTELAEKPAPEMFIGGVIGLFMPLSQILNGTGLLITKTGPRFCSILIILSGITFFVGQGTFNLTEVISPGLMVLGFFPIGAGIMKLDDWTEY